MKQMKRALAFALAMLVIFAASCGRTGNDPTTSAQIPNNKTTCYNIIFALATIPPVLAALDAIGNGYETYAIIERGKTYNGIDSLEYFHNAGFDPSNNQSTGFTEQEFNSMVERERMYISIYTFRTELRLLARLLRQMQDSPWTISTFICARTAREPMLRFIIPI